MNGLKRMLYKTVIGAVRVYQRLFLDLHVWGAETIPPGPKLYITNHITSLDGLWVLPVFTEPVRVVIGPAYKSNLLARVWDAMDQINAMPEHRKTVVDEAVKRIEAGASVYIVPEGDFAEQFQLGRFYPGFARIYLRTGVPIVPIALVAPNHRMREVRWFKIVVEGRVYRTLLVLRGPFLINVGTPMTPDCPAHLDEKEQTEFVIRQVRDRVAQLVDEARTNKFWLS